MTIEMQKIGVILNSRPAGREALLAMRPHLRGVEDVVLDFSGVNVLTPSFADEFVTPLVSEYKDRLLLTHTKENITVFKTLEFLSEDWGEGKVMME